MSTADTWGTSLRMTDVEAIFWRSESDPRLRSAGVVLDLLETEPDWERLWTAHEWAVRLIPRLHQRVADDPLHLSPPRWVPAEVDLDQHLSRIELAPGQGFEAVLEHAAALHMAALDRTRPLWRGVLVTGLPDGSSCYLFKVHHSVADGTGIVELFDLLHSHTAEPSVDRVIPPPVPAEQPHELLLPAGALLTLAQAAPAAALTLLGRVAGAVTGGALSGWVSAGADYAASLRRVTAKPSGTPSPLLHERGIERRLGTVEIPLAHLRAAGKAAGGTVNDAYLAGLLGGLGRYHRAHETAVADLPVAFPVSLRQKGDAVGGNAFAAAMIAGPAGERDPVRRIRLVHERVEIVRAEPALDFMGASAPLVSRLPSMVLAKAALRLSTAIDLQASNIPGLHRPAYLAGARIRRMFVFGPVPGCAVMATLLSHEETCCIGITVDRAAVQDVDLLLDCFTEGMHEMSDLAAQGAST